MRTPKTQPTAVEPTAFIDAVDNDQRRKDARELLELMQSITGEPPQMWGGSIVGFGRYHYRYATGHEGDAPLTGFSPRKQSLVLYLGPGLDHQQLTAKLGKHKTGKGCLYLNKLDDVDRGILRELIAHSVAEMRRQYAPATQDT